MWLPYTRFREPYSDVFLQIFFFFFKVWSPYTKFMESYSDVLKPYSGVLELDFPKIEFHAYIYIYIFIVLLGTTRFSMNRVFNWNSILRQSSIEIGARAYIVWKQWHIAKFFKKKDKMPESPLNACQRCFRFGTIFWELNIKKPIQ